MNNIDLHVHSTASDGTFTPTQLVEYAVKKGLSAFALTDHDTISGIREALDTAKKMNITVIPGIELSSDYNGTEIHILGLYIDRTNKELQAWLNHFVNERDLRNKKMAQLLISHGFSIDFEELKQKYPASVLTRAHFASYLVDKQFVSTRQEAFDRYLGDGCPCYVEREKVSPFDAISLIHKANGYAILAHPLQYKMPANELHSFILTCKEHGLHGMETIYSLYSEQEQNSLTEFAKKHGLLITGGSDFHGANKPSIDLGTGKGNLQIPSSLLTAFTNA